MCAAVSGCDPNCWCHYFPLASINLVLVQWSRVHYALTIRAVNEGSREFHSAQRRPLYRRHYVKLAFTYRRSSRDLLRALWNFAKVRWQLYSHAVTAARCQVPRGLAMASGQPLSRLGSLINKSTNSDTFINSDREQQTLWNSLFIWIVFEVYFSCCDIFRSLWSIVLSERRTAAGPRPAAAATLWRGKWFKCEDDLIWKYILTICGH